MDHNIFKGLGIALVTPFTKDGSVDFVALEKLIDYQLIGGADFFCILATTGETPTLTLKEKKQIKDLVVKKVNHRLPILVGCGGFNTSAVIDELQNGDFSQVDGILSVCPYYNKPSQEGLYEHFKAISKASKLPIVLYNVPGRTGVNIKAETTLRLARECGNIVGIKEAGSWLDQVDEVVKNKPEGFDVISGDDAMTFSMIASGAVGAISVIGNALPKQFASMIHLALDGKISQAREIHQRLIDLYELLFNDGNPSGIKAMLSQMGMIENHLRLPLVPASKETSLEIAKQIKLLEV